MNLKHTIIYFLSKGFPGILSFFALIFYSKNLLPEEYGKYSLIISIAGIINIIFFDWIRFGMSRFYPEFIAQDKKEKFKGFLLHLTKYSFYILISFTILFLILSNYKLINYSFTFVVTLSVLVFFQFLYSLFTQLFITELKPTLFSIANLLKVGLGVSLSITFIYYDYGINGLLIGILIGYLISNLYSFYKINFDLNLKENNILLLPEVLKYSLPLTASASFSFILSYSNRFIIEYYRGVEETGLFTMAFDFVQQTIGVFISIAATSSLPIAMKLYTENKTSEEFKSHMKKSLNLLLLITFPFVAIYITSYKEILTIVLGKNFNSLSYNLIPVLAISTFLMGIKGFYLDFIFYFKKETKYQTLILVLIAIFNIVLNCIFIPIYGYISAAYIGLLSSTLILLITYFVTNRLISIPFDLTMFLKLVASFITMLCLLFYLGESPNLISLLIKLFFGVLIYLILLGGLNYTFIYSYLKIKK